MTLLQILILSGISSIAAAEEKQPAAPGELTRLPELVEFVEATYPEEAKAAGLEGAVKLLITVDETGLVTGVELVEGAGHGFDQAAEQAAWKFRFRPAMMGETPVPVAITYTYRFVMTEEAKKVIREAPPPEPETPEPPPPLPINLTGRVLERGTRNALALVEVSLPALEQAAMTDETGRFSFRGVPAGSSEITLALVGYEITTTEVQVAEGEKTDITVYLERLAANRYHLTVRGKRPKQVVTRHVLDQEEIQRIPGTLGDSMKVVSVLPGVARVTMGMGGLLILRGADDSSSMAYVDGTFIPYLYHFGGIRSVLNSGMVEELEFYPGNMGVFYQNAIGGVLEARTRKPKADRWHFEADLNVFEGGFMVEGPITEDLTVLAALHRNWHDLVLGAVWPDDEDASFTAAPVYYDYQLKVHWDVHPDHELELFALGSDDQMKLIIGTGEETDVGFGMHNFFQRVNLKHTWRLSPSVTNTLTPNLLVLYQDGTFHAENYLEMTDLHLAIRDDLQWRITEGYQLNAGARFAWERMNISFSAHHLGRMGDGDPDALSNTESRTGEATISSPIVSAYAELVAEPLEGLKLIPGVRLDYYDFTQRAYLGGSFTVRYGLFDGTVLKGAIGTYTRFPWGPEVVEGYGNPDLSNERSVQYALGVEQEITDLLSVDLTVFYQEMDDLVVSNPALNTDPQAIPYTNDGLGHAVGLEIMVKHEPSDWFTGWVSYTLSRSERKFPGQDWELFTFDQTHILAAVGMLNLPGNWSIGLRFRLVSGNPQPVYNAKAGFNADMGSYMPPTYATRTERRPLVHTLDLRVDKTFVFDRVLWSIYLDIQNVYDHRNAEADMWNYDYTEHAYVEGLPILPAIGTKVVF